MQTHYFTPSEKLSKYVKSILVFENTVLDKHTVLPFFADGYPGIMFQNAQNGVFLQPKNKPLSTFFLYGQTLHPIELTIDGAYQLVVFQIYPTAVKSLLNINLKDITDDCYNLDYLTLQYDSLLLKKIADTEGVAEKVKLLNTFLEDLADQTQSHIDFRIQKAIQLIFEHKGKLSIKALREQLHFTERTFERQFLEQVGVSPKRFSKIVQFKLSLDDISEANYSKLTDIVFENGFADQSHFIRNFKQYTGSTPSVIKRKLK